MLSENRLSCVVILCRSVCTDHCWFVVLGCNATLTLFQTKDFTPLFADYNFRFDENGKKFYKRLENTVGKGEIACFEQFFLFQQCFLKIYTADT